MVEFHFIFYEERNGTMTKIDIISGFLGAGPGKFEFTGR